MSRESRPSPLSPNPTPGASRFHELFERSFSPRAAAAGVGRKRGKAVRWVAQPAGEPALTIAFRLNRKNLAGYPFQFMPDIAWEGQRYDERDTGEVSFYQYALPEEIASVAALQKRIVDTFIAEMHLEAELKNDGSLVSTLASAARLEIRPNHQRWLPYWTADDVTAWGDLFGAGIGGWLLRFRANPETLETWCWRELWSKRNL